MAKILAKHSYHSRIIKLRSKLEGYKEEILSLDTKYDSKKEKQLNAFARKENKALVKLAFEACNKEEYAQSVLEDKLREYDIKAYMKQRAINHGAAKKIFKLCKAGKPFGYVLVECEKKIAALKKQRKAYIKHLEKKKASFLAKKPVTYVVPYRRRKVRLDAEYLALEAKLNKEYGDKILKERSILEAKISKLEKQISKLQKLSPAKYTLPDDVVLRVEGLKMYFGGLKAVDDLTFDVKKGEIFGLIGPNGAGKTTVFNCITQFYKPTAGKLTFASKDNEIISLTDYKVHDILLTGIARTFQNIEVVKEVTVLENLLIAATRSYTSNLLTQTLHLPLLRREEKLIRAKADRILKYMDLYAYRDRLAWGLPYGVLKRIEIARVLMTNPQLIVLDEPAAGLNESETHELAELINKIRKDFDCTILLVEHDMGLVMKICDHICAISFGKKLAYGTASEIQASKEVQEAYLGVGGDE